MAVYGGTAYIIFEAATLIFPRWGLPDWTIDLLLYVLIFGAIITFVLSWVYDITPSGIERTRPSGEQDDEEISVSTGWKVATYASLAIILALIVINAAGIRKINHTDDLLEKSIAVLPFQNFSEADDQDFVCLGLTDEIINHLFKLKSFDKVSSLTSVLTYREGSKRSTEIGEELGVNYILEGTYRKIGDELKISAQLIEAHTDRHIWQKEFDRPYGQLLSLQSDIALQIAGRIKVFISNEEKERIQKLPTNSLTAYECYLRGIEIYNLHSDFPKAIAWFEKAIEADSTFALAYSYIAQCYQFIYRYSYSNLEAFEDAHLKAREAAEKAYVLDPYLGEALAVYGLILAEDLEFAAAEELLLRSVKYSPGSPEVHSSHAQFLRWMGRYEECIEIGKRVIEMEPMNPMNYIWLAAYYMYSGQYKSAIKSAHEAVRHNADPILMNFYLAVSNSFLERHDKGVTHADSVLSNMVLPSHFFMFGGLGWVYARAGYEEKTREFLDYLTKLSETQFVDPIYLSFPFTALGEYDKVFACLDKNAELHTGQTVYIRSYADLFMKELADDPRYDQLLIKIGFEPLNSN
jgi:TolB-like protein/Tfp pilus assembly protein PilF